MFDATITPLNVSALLIEMLYVQVNHGPEGSMAPERGFHAGMKEPPSNAGTAGLLPISAPLHP